MKKLLIIAVMFITSISLNAQDYSHSSLEVSGGLTKVRDITQVEPINIDLAYRFMANTKFGAVINLNYTDVADYNLEYASAGLHGVINIGRLLEFESFTKNYTILSGVGGTYTLSSSTTNSALLHRISNFHLSAFVDNEFRISDKVFLKLGLDVITGVNARPFAANILPTQTTTILNGNLGVVINLSKKVHADWWLDEEKEPVIVYNTIDKTVTNYVMAPETKEACACTLNEYIVFRHDSDLVEYQGGATALKVASNLKDGQIITLVGYASTPGESGYNINLSNRRALAVKSKFISLGVAEDRIVIEFYGELETIDSNNKDLSRHVGILVN